MKNVVFGLGLAILFVFILISYGCINDDPYFDRTNVRKAAVDPVIDLTDESIESIIYSAPLQTSRGEITLVIESADYCQPTSRQWISFFSGKTGATSREEYIESAARAFYDDSGIIRWSMWAYDSASKQEKKIGESISKADLPELLQRE